MSSALTDLSGRERERERGGERELGALGVEDAALPFFRSPQIVSEIWAAFRKEKFGMGSAQ
jgi:hypothetical protein